MLKREKELMLFGLNPNQYSFKGLGIFLFIYIGASLFAAIFTAPTYWLVQWIDSIKSTDLTNWLLGKPIDVFYDRLRWAPIILGLPWMMKECKLFSIRNLGLPIQTRSLWVFIKFFVLGLVLAALIFTMQYFFANVSINPDFVASRLPKILLSAILGGVILGFLEELVFRCLILRSIYTALGAISGVVLTSLFFAYKHFKVPNSIWDSLPGGIHSSTWDIGFFVGYYDTIGIASTFQPLEFFSLFMFGMVLAMIYVRTKILWGPVAMHAGIVFAIQTYRSVFSVGASDNVKYVGSAGMTNGYLALTLLTLIFIWLLFFYPKKVDTN